MAKPLRAGNNTFTAWEAIFPSAFFAVNVKLVVQPPAVDWGRMISEGQAYLAQAWWTCLFPGAAIVLLALGFRLLADGLMEWLRIEV